MKAWEAALLALAVGAAVLLAVRWVGLDERPPEGDLPGRIHNAVKFWLQLREGNWSQAADPYPPLAYLPGLAVFQARGPSVDAALLSQLAFMPVLLASLWWAGRKVSGPLGGAAVLLAAAGCPWIAIFGRTYDQAMATATMVALTLALLLASDRFTRPWPTVGLGVALALGMLAKWSYLFFVLGPLAVEALGVRRGWIPAGVALAALAGTAAVLGERLLALRHVPLPGPSQEHLLLPLMGLWAAVLAVALRSPRSEGRGLALALALGHLGCLWWYVAQLPLMAHKVAFESRGDIEFAHNLLLNAWTLARSQWALALWVQAGLVAGMAVPALRRPTLLAAAGLATSLVVVSATSASTPRYLFPAVPCALLLGFAWVGAVPRLGLPAALVLAALLPLQVSGLEGLPVRPLHSESQPRQANRTSLLEWTPPAVSPPDPTPYPMEESLRRLASRGHFRVAVLADPAVKRPEAVGYTNFELATLVDRVLLHLEDLPWGSPRPVARAVLVVAARPLEEVRQELPWLREMRLLGSWAPHPEFRWWTFEATRDPGGPARR